MAVIPDSKDYIGAVRKVRNGKRKKAVKEEERNGDESFALKDPKETRIIFMKKTVKTFAYEYSVFREDRVKTILLTSCYPNEGKSDIAFTLSLQRWEKTGKRVLLIDADIRKSSYIQYGIYIPYNP